MQDFLKALFEGGNIAFTLVGSAMIFFFFKGEEGSDERRYAKSCFFALMVLLLYADLDRRHDTQEACDRGDQSACMDIEIEDYYDEQRADSYR
jgi:hypothetical protein